ncbi:small heat shock protein HspD [Labrys miyagiensis]|uniref:Small heat shock protein HspD n=1 Tax=Labrys miyagiensis TaxID=346912 RepID=A0ABQ6CPG3_9HYPH|nr:Hsp20 family protein [Labrys miyagiensis]GLS20594.1 small heat shock protein HspD [Labrys miyagiensis]
MRNYDFTPFSRSAIGFDRLFELLNAQSHDSAENFPPYDIVRTGEDTFRISLAVAGFSPSDITVTAQQNLLTVAGRKAEASRSEDYVYQGISSKAFERRFNLADYVEVDSAGFENGLLQINLARKVPEAMKPRRVEIVSAKDQAQSRQRLGDVNAA